jgi:hypothetical protein
MGAQAAKMGLDIYNQAKTQGELEKIADAKPEATTGYTAEQGTDLSAAAASGQYDIGVKTRDDGTFDSYTVTPKADQTQTGVIAQQDVTDFMGKRTAGTMTDDQVARARTMAMAGVVSKTNPIEGLRMQQAVTAGERDDQRFKWETDRADRDKRKADDKEAYTAARQDAYKNSIHGRNMTQYVQAYKTWEEGGKQGEAPAMPTYSLAQSLADTGALLAVDAERGRADPKALQQYAATMKQVRDEGYVSALRVAQSGGSAAQIAEAFNKAGTMKVEPGAIQVGKGKGPDGMPTTMLTLRDGQGKVQTLNVVAELDALGQADKYFNRFYKAEDNKRGNAQLELARSRDVRDAASSAITNRLHGAQADEAEARATARKDLTAAQTELNAAIEAGNAQAEAAARKKLSTFALGAKGSQMDPLERKAALYLGSGRAKTMAEALDLAHQKVQSSPRDDYMKLTTGPMPKGDKELDAHMRVLHGDTWKEKVNSEGGGGGQSMETDPRAKAIRDDPKLTREQKLAKLRELGYK